MSCGFLSAQFDTLRTSTGELFIGTATKLSESELTFESESGEEDYIIDWKKVTQLNTYHFLRIVTRTRLVSEGVIRDTLAGDPFLTFYVEGEAIQLRYDDILSMEKLEETFLEKLDLGINLGYSFTKATNTTQLSLRAAASYTTEKWSFDADYNEFLTIIDSLQTNRFDASTGSRYLMMNYWFLSSSANWFSSDEQEIRLRTTVLFGGGRYVLFDQVKTMQLGTGIALNSESFDTEDQVAQESFEAYLSMKYHLFDHKYLDIKTNAIGYASLTESDRYRASVNLDFGWDIGDSFDLIWGYSLNFDSNPPNNAEETDYVVSLTIGWEL